MQMVSWRSVDRSRTTGDQRVDPAVAPTLDLMRWATSCPEASSGLGLAHSVTRTIALEHVSQHRRGGESTEPHRRRQLATLLERGARVCPACRRCVVGGQEGRAARVPARAVFALHRSCREVATGTDRGRIEVGPSTVGRRRRRLGAGLRELSKRTLAEFYLRVAIRAREVVTPTDVALMDGLTDESPALALDTQRRQVELIHNPSTAECVVGLHEEGVGR